MFAFVSVYLCRFPFVEAPRHNTPGFPSAFATDPEPGVGGGKKDEKSDRKINYIRDNRSKKQVNGYIKKQPEGLLCNAVI